jgi:gamma-glutamyltranspeptidase/glutathione hydrolase
LLCVVEPISNGIGGDCFALYFDAQTRRVTALNGSGRSAAGTDAASLRQAGHMDMPKFTGAAVTVPGAVRGWGDLLERHGTMPLKDLLAPAIEAATSGFPVTEWIAESWKHSESKLRRDAGWQSGDKDNGPPQPSGAELLKDGRAPRFGEIVRLPEMAATLRGIAEGGPDYIYNGEFAARAAAHVQRYGGWISADDFATHAGEWVEPLSTNYRGVTLYECPPNGQGLAAIIACSLADGFDFAAMDETARLTHLIACMRAGFQEAQRWVADPATSEIPLAELLSREYAARKRAELNVSKAFQGHLFGPKGDDTVYLSVVDGKGNACSFIQSCYMGTGTGLVVPGTGVSLQNRGHGFTLEEGHPNCLAPNKRPYHTIIPAITTRDGELHACFGVMGGHMQPQGHLQVLTHLLDGLSPQAALDQPRWQLVGREARLMVEPGFSTAAIQGLMERGHLLERVDGFDRIHMGGGQVIVKHGEVLIGGSDPRKDGCALGL